MPSENLNGALTVTELNNYIKDVFDNDRYLSGVTVKGEISNFKSHSTGHLYFSLKDEGSIIRAVMFRSSAHSLPFVPENGMKVVARGRVTSFVRDGQYQLYAESMEPDGIGALYIAYEQLKRKLEVQGLFDPARKKPLPKIPSRIGIITSPTGAAIRDMINVTGRRFPYAKIILYPALVQGPGAAPDLIAGLDYFNRNDACDVIIIGRGGGSIEDIWAFNSEKLARKIFASETPIISAVGHETDFTICDFVADFRAPTPSAAAEIAVPDKRELLLRIDDYDDRLTQALIRTLQRARERLARLAEVTRKGKIDALVDIRREKVEYLMEKAVFLVNNTVKVARERLVKNGAKVDSLSPLSTLLRGYSIAEINGGLVRSVSELKIGDEITLRLSDGKVRGCVNEIRKENDDREGN